MKGLMKKINHFYRTTVNIAIGNPNEFQFEHRFFNSILFLVVVISFLASIINLLLQFDMSVTSMTLISLVVYLLLYWFSRFKKILEPTRWIAIIVLLVLLIPMWFTNGGSKGPIIFIFTILFSYTLLMLDKFAKKLLIFLIVIELVTLLAMEYYYPEWVSKYDNDLTRMIDLLTALLMYFSLGAVIIIYARKNYIKEKLKAEKSDYLKSAFLANMSHEIRTPMNSIIGFSQLLNRENLEKSKKEQYIKIINDNGKYLLRLIGDIIDISKIEADQMKFMMTRLNLKDLFLRLYTTFDQLLGDSNKRNILLKYELFVDENISFITDETRLEQIFTNLMLNAIKFTHRGSITFGYKLRGNEILFYVKDTGIGIQKENLGEIFDRFRKVETEHSNVLFKGTGIGLALSKSLVEMLKGKIWVESSYGEGSVFYFTHPAEGLQINQSSESDKKKKTRLVNWSKKKMLLVEDENSNVYFIKELLAPTGIEIFVVNNGHDAVDFVTSHDCDLVLMDIKLPEMSGYETTRKIKQIKPDLPVLAQTAYAMESDEQKSFDAGCDDYIPKPFDVDLLMEKIKSLLKKRN